MAEDLDQLMKRQDEHEATLRGLPKDTPISETVKVAMEQAGVKERHEEAVKRIDEHEATLRGLPKDTPISETVKEVLKK